MRIQKQATVPIASAPIAGGEAKGDGPTHDRASHRRIFLLFTGDIAEGRGHFDQALALYDPAEHRSLATRFGQDTRMTLLSYRSLALWLLGCPEAALSDADEALKNSREIGQAATLMFAIRITQTTYGLCGNRVATAVHAQELVALAEEKGVPFWKAFGVMNQGSVLALTGRASGATEMLISGIAAYRTMGATISCHSICRTRPAPMRRGNSRRLGAALAKR